MKTQNDLVEAAKKYLARGWSVIPVSADKKPIGGWKKFQDRRPSPVEVEFDFLNDKAKGVAVITGSLSGIVILDTEAGADLSKLDIPPTAKAKTGGGGIHFFFKNPRGKTVPRKIRVLEKVDVLGERGYAILPPSLHSSGNRYEWIADPETTPIADAPDWLLKLTEPRAKQPELGTPNPEQVASVPIAVKEGARNDATARLSGKLLSRFPEYEWESHVWPLVRELNRLNQPPLGEGEVRQVFESISKTEREKKPKTTSAFAPMRIGDLLAMAIPPAKWLIEKLLPVGGRGVISGRPGSYKTWILLHMAMQVSRGEPVFGSFKTTKGSVLLIDEENRLQTLRERIEKLGYVASDNIYLLSLEGFKVDKEENMRKLEAFVELHDIRLVIMDSLVRVHQKDENDAGQMKDVFDALKPLVKKDVAILFTHHHRKQPSDDEESPSKTSQRLRGSSDILAAIESHVAVSNEVAGRLVLVQTKSRDDEAQKPFEVNIETKDGRLSFEFEGEIKDSVLAFEQAKEKIHEFLVSEGREVDRAEIETKLKPFVGENSIGKALKTLAEENKIEVQRGVKNKKIYKARPDTPEQLNFDF
ncbi:MAG: Bifunctional DNA primase/polymerase [Parcubacteria group bacterium GW2011_GWA1_53_13]|nr:MAG: Bifunctional DNA primase/polymerase [Parcubacteria group bacterium GW2011_GWA2_49_16]KKW33608.1 MAG: Bifunctional DNA primase/polymerase [Parcubacteria group bacterium GW2011_GWA1_53_13]